MSADSESLPDLEPRFLPPKGWRWHTFKNPQGRKLRFGSVYPPGRIATSVVVVLPGLSEYCEKYFELAHNLTAANHAMWIMDWQGQGKSDRHLNNPHKRHSVGFEEDVADLHYFIKEYVKHSAVHPDVGRIPLVMLGHSMGANIGLRFLHEYPDIFECAAFTAPMLGIYALRFFPPPLDHLITGLFSEAVDQAYAFGGGDWKSELRPTGDNRFSSDPLRREIHNAWCLHDPELQVGGVTFGWLYRAVESCEVLRIKKTLKEIKTPCLMAVPGHEVFVKNRSVRRAAKIMPNAQLLELPGSAHEILMEADGVRDVFLNAFYELLKTNVVDNPESLKPF